MRHRLAWALLGGWVILSAGAGVLHLEAGDWSGALFTSALGVLAGVGALLVSRHPGNPVGWILLGLALWLTASILAEAIYIRWEEDPAPPMAVRLLVWVDAWTVYLWFGLVGIALPLLFPDGRLPSHRWRVLAWIGAAVLGVAIVGTGFGTPGYDWGERGRLTNPLAIGGLLGEGLEWARAASGVPFAVVLACALWSVVVRLRRSRGVERQQLKLFVYAIALLLCGLVAALIGEVTGFAPLGNAGWFLFLGAFALGLPVAIALAILRHRLYDIDVVVNRTLVYGTLTATLAGVYLGCVLLAGLAVGESGPATAVATLAVAALFRPARSRIQAVVDRRFYRRRYDATRTLEGFSGRLRDEVDLEALGAEVRGVVRETVQPTHVSLWLRSPGAGR